MVKDFSQYICNQLWQTTLYSFGYIYIIIWDTSLEDVSHCFV